MYATNELGLIMENLKFNDIQETINDLRDAASHEASKEATYIRSRGVTLKAIKGTETLNEDGDTFKNKKELLSLTQKFKEKGADAIFIEGGFDGADSPHDMINGHYEPWVGEWSFKLWTKQDGFNISEKSYS